MPGKQPRHLADRRKLPQHQKIAPMWRAGQPPNSPIPGSLRCQAGRRRVTGAVHSLRADDIDWPCLRALGATEHQSNLPGLARLRPRQNAPPYVRRTPPDPRWEKKGHDATRYNRNSTLISPMPSAYRACSASSDRKSKVRRYPLAAAGFINSGTSTSFPTWYLVLEISYATVHYDISESVLLALVFNISSARESIPHDGSTPAPVFISATGRRFWDR